MVGGIGLVGVPGERVLREGKGSDSAIQSTTETGIQGIGYEEVQRTSSRKEW